MKTQNYIIKYITNRVFGKKYYNRIKLEKIILEFYLGIDFNQIYQIISKLFEDNAIFLDVGANMGKETSRLSKKFPNGKILAIEPVSFNFQALHKFKKRANLDNVTIINKAISDRSGKMKINIPVMNSGVVVGTRSTLKSDIENGTNYLVEEIETDTIDNIANEFRLSRLDYIKCDTEGFDAIALASGKETIKIFKPFIRVEESWKNNGFNWLLEFGYETFYLVKNKFISANKINTYQGDSFFIHKDKMSILEKIQLSNENTI